MDKLMEKIKTVEIHDQVFEETYTAHIQRNGANWLGFGCAKIVYLPYISIST